MSRLCEICGKLDSSGMRHAKRSACFPCIDEAIEFVITNKEAQQ